MKRIKDYKIKREKPETSTHRDKEREEHDLAYYIHDRVELMHQVFSVLKPKELKAMAPECVRHISVDDLQELCLEELLGISSKRLCAILDGAEPPSDTESSSQSQSPERLETISLDSISSDEEILSQTSSKKGKKHKHRRRESKTKSKHKKKSKEKNDEEPDDRSKASRAGLTVLELLELQARARAIRAQLQQEQPKQKETTTAESSHHSSDNEVEIKEEPAEVVEISSDDEKPTIEDLQRANPPSTSKEAVRVDETSQTITKRKNDLIITVPQSKPTRKIKLNRSKVTVSVTNITEKNIDVANTENTKKVNKPDKTEPTRDITSGIDIDKERPKKKQKKKKKKRSSTDKEGSDHDEITLQLSDTEKMDLLEDFDRKNYDNVTSSSSEDSESSSSDSDVDKKEKIKKVTENKKETAKAKEVDKAEIEKESKKEEINISDSSANIEEKLEEKVEVNNEHDSNQDENLENVKITGYISTDNENLESIEVKNINDIPIVDDNQTNNEDDIMEATNDNSEEPAIHCGVSTEIENGESVASNVKGKPEKELSEGELSDRESSEVEAFDLQPEVVCISDEETGTDKSHKKKKSKKKEKKSKKEKKLKKSKLDFRESADQNFFREAEDLDDADHSQVLDGKSPVILDDDDEILELSDESSCYEVEGVSVLSKEPTAEEIEALSAKIDEIERVEVITEEQIREHEQIEREKEENEDLENISWKDRYLDSKKVKQVLSTSNILNALRKKNKELKKKLEERKRDTEVEPQKVEEKSETCLVEGSVDHYNTLEGSTKYVNPVPDPEDKEETEKTDEDQQVTREMKKDAKQLLKMYKKLLKYNDMNKQKDPNKKKKKKQKKNKDNDVIIDKDK